MSFVISQISHLPLVSNLRDKIVEYVYKQIMKSYLPDDYPTNKIKTEYEDGELSLDMNNVVLDENKLNSKLSNIYFLNGGYLEDEDFQEEDNFNLPIVFTENVNIGGIKIRLPLFSLLDKNSQVEINQTKIHLRLNLLSQLLSKQLRTNIQETFKNSLMNSSIQIAEDLISNSKINPTEDFDLNDKIKGYEGYEALADVIRRILGRIEFHFNDLIIQLTDNNQNTKVELKIKRIDLTDEEQPQTNDELDKQQQQQNSEDSDDNYYETKSTDEQQQQQKDNQDSNSSKQLIKLIKLEGFEVYVDGSLISRSNSKHTIRYDIEQNKIDIVIGSILSLVLNPDQLDSLISVLTNKADETHLDHLKIKKEFKDKKITDDEMIKIKEFMNKERTNKLNNPTNSNAGSNKLSINKINQIWSTGFSSSNNVTSSTIEEDEEIKFYEFNNNKKDNNHHHQNQQQQQQQHQDNEQDKKDKQKELNPFNLTCKIPGISINLLNTKETEHEYVDLENINLDLIEINNYLLANYKRKDSLNLILLNNFIHFRDQLNIKLSNLMLCETYKGINELILFNNGDGTTISENIYIDLDLNENIINLKSKQDILINIDLTFYERIQSYLNFNRLQINNNNNNNFNNQTKNLLDSTILKDQSTDDIQFKFNFNLDLKNLNGKLFFPIPNLTENLPKQFSDLHNDCLEFNSSNMIIKIDSKELKIYSDFIEINLIENYLQFREDQQKSTNEMKTIQLISSKVCEFRSLGSFKNLIELIIIFKPDVNGSILIDNGKQQQQHQQQSTQKQTTNSQFLNEQNLEDSVFVTNTYNLDSVNYQPFKSKNRKIVSDENQHEAEKILPNDKMSSINYLNSAAKVSKMNIILNIPQALLLFSDQAQLNLVYNRLANDLLLWVPFNGANNFNQETTSTSINKNKNNKPDSRKTSLNNRILESDGNLIDINEDFAHFDANVMSYSRMAQKRQSFNDNDLMTQSFIRNDYLDTSTNHFDINNLNTRNPTTSSSSHFNQTSFRMCKSGLEESTESDNAMYHSLNYSTVNPIYDLINETTFVVNCNEIVLHFEHKIKEDEVLDSKLNNQTSSPTIDSKLNSIHEFFSNYQLIENQTLLGKKLLVGCVVKMEKDNATRVFIHSEDVRFKMNNLGPVNKLQSVCVYNNQFLMIGSNKLVNSIGDCKLNLGIEIKRESKDLKKIKIAIQLIDALLLQININEIMKFWNYVNVIDEEVIGYVPPSILTELHVNLINTAFLVEPECFCNNFNNPFYSPLNKSKSTGNLKTNSDKLNNFNNECPTCENLNNHLENRPGLLLFNDASIICLIMEKTSEVVLNFTFDDTSLFFAKQIPDYSPKLDNLSRQLNGGNQLKEAYHALDLLSLSNYVCNISCGSLEIGLMLDSGNLKEIKLNNDLINITCCYDSLAALICLLQKHLQSSSSSSSSTTTTTTTTDHHSSNNNNNSSTSKLDQDSLIEQRENLLFNDDYLNSLNSRQSTNNRLFTDTTTVDNILNDLNSNILNTPPDSTTTTTKSKTPSPLLYDPTYLDDDEEDVKINAANQIRQPKQQQQQKKSQSLDTSFYILGYDDFGTGIKVSKNSEPEYNSLSGKLDLIQDCYFTVPQMVNIPIFCPKKTLFRFLLEEMSINLHIFGGTDFQENLISSNQTEDLKAEFSDDNFSINERRSSLSSNSSFGSPSLHSQRQTTVRFADTPTQYTVSLSSAVAVSNNERTYDKTTSLNSNLSKFDYLAANFGQQLFIFKKQVNDDFFEQIKSTDSRRKSLNGKEDCLWEDLDLFTYNSTDGLRSSANVAIIKKSGGFKRNNQMSVKLELKKMKCLFEKYVDGNPIAWNASYACSEIEIMDCVRKSRINKILYEYTSDQLPKRSQPMLSVKIINNRSLMSDKKIYADGRIEQKKKRRHHSTNSQISDYSSNAGSLSKHSTSRRSSKKVYDSNSSDCDLIISMNPLRINIDQDTILFIMDFFTDFSLLLEKEVIADCSSTTTLNETYSPNNSLANQPIVDYPLMKETQSMKSGGSSSSSISTRDSNKQPIFIKHFEFSQDVPIKLDYQSKQVDIKKNGALYGLLMGLTTLNGSELTLKQFSYRRGILGFEKVLLFAIEYWANDIKKYQLPSILGGVGPTHSLIQLFKGVRDLFIMPIDQYRKDKRLVRGLQKGLFSFSTSSTIALLELTNKSLGLIEFAAQILYDLMSGTSALKKERSLALSYELRWNQPRDAREGALNAYNVLTEGFQQASRNLSLVHGESNTALSLIRKLPANAFILPILTTQATSNILTGVRNQMEPQARKEDQNKWKS